jgi:hypothetical protein
MSESPFASEPGCVSRVVKLAMDTGESQTVEEALALFESYRARVRIGADVAHSAALQAILFTVINTGRRCFLGGVAVDAPTSVLSAATLVHVPGARRVGEAVNSLGAVEYRPGAPPAPEIWIGDVEPSERPAHPVSIRATFDGWRGAAVSLDSNGRLPESGNFTPAGVLAGALAVGEIFQHFRGDTVDAGYRDVGLSLWRPQADVEWRSDDGAPSLMRLPARLWMLGLGHLGQAYLWTLGLLPYADPSSVSLVLQDIDALEDANDSTSLLTHSSLVGQKKTRAMTAWAESRGFRTTIIEREFAADFSLGSNEPRLLLGGVDNPLARAELEKPGFSRIVDAGLGNGTREYLAFQLHSFPSHSRAAESLWSPGLESSMVEPEILDQPAYRALAAAGMDDCGLTTLAGRSVGAPFVGATAAALVVAEAIRMAMGAHSYAVIDATLRGLERRQALLNEKFLEPVNLGLTDSS